MSVSSLGSTQNSHSVLLKDQKRRLLRVTAGLIMATNLLYLWLPFRVGAVQLLIFLGASRLFIGAEYSSLDAPRYIPYGPATQIDGCSSDTEVIGAGIEWRDEKRFRSSGSRGT